MLTDWRLWKRYPALILVRFMQNTIRTTALLFFIMVLALLTSTAKVRDLPVGFIAVSLGLNWLLMLYFGAKLKRFKIWLYPLMFILNPAFNWYYMVYGVLTAGTRTWGGPRADAATADVHTTAREAAEQAAEQGDELNIVPESFKPAQEARALANDRGYVASSLARKRSVVRPPDTVDGQFSGTSMNRLLPIARDSGECMRRSLSTSGARSHEDKIRNEPHYAGRATAPGLVTGMPGNNVHPGNNKDGDGGHVNVPEQWPTRSSQLRPDQNTIAPEQTCARLGYCDIGVAI